MWHISNQNETHYPPSSGPAENLTNRASSPVLAFLPLEDNLTNRTHGNGFPGSYAGKESACNIGVARDTVLTPDWLGRSSAERNGNSLQFSCLENPMNRGAWWATVHGGSQRVGYDWSDWACTHTPMVSVLICSSCVTRYHNLGALRDRNISHTSGSWKSKVKVQVSSVPGETFFLALQTTAFWLCLHMAGCPPHDLI